MCSCWLSPCGKKWADWKWNHCEKPCSRWQPVACWLGSIAWFGGYCWEGSLGHETLPLKIGAVFVPAGIAGWFIG